MAGGRGWHRSAAALHQAIQLPGRQGRHSIPLRWTEPTDQPDAEYDLHLNNGRLLEHFHEGNMTYRADGIREKTPALLSKYRPNCQRSAASRAAAGCSLISRYGKVRVRALVTDRVHGQRTLHADELRRRAGEPADQQPHGQDHPHAGLQGNFRATARCWARSARIRCRAPTPASATRRRRRASRWSANGSARIIANPAHDWCKSRPREIEAHYDKEKRNGSPNSP